MILTLFVSLTLVGLGVLLNQQADKAAEQWGSELQITAFLCKARDDNPACTGGGHRRPEARDRRRRSRTTPRSTSYRFESKEEAFDKVKELLGAGEVRGSQPGRDRRRHAASRCWITLKDPEEYQGIKSAIVGLDGV